MSERHYAYYQNRECEYFPCHPNADPDNFNCLFCYCPLYALGEHCGGNFSFTAKGYKDCSKCLVPHRKENFDLITGKYSQIADLVRKNRLEEHGGVLPEEK